ncbi:uncharacterized protein L3040_006834 [Drepanopeziza brunnea f. sp. 'multigermtubi']|nr:hypothetical protein L3040_006834 [Drepanopeziza brunnea f. sp. 'multigermtubi']
MSRPSTALKLSKLLRSARGLSTTVRSPSRLRTSIPRAITAQANPQSFTPASPFSTTQFLAKGLSPESADPAPKEAESESYTTASAPADITAEEYHELADAYLDALIEKLETLQEEREEVDVEYSAGVLTLAFPPNGTYVLNKQPPNKQIWLSSPLTGPKRYDYVMLSEGQDAKEGTGRGEWVYLRDGSSLTEVLEGELGIVVAEV